MAVLKRPDLERLLDKWDRKVRLLLFAGPEESTSHDLAQLALKKLADPADPMALTDLPADELRRDPGKLTDEAASTSMFGGHRAIRVTGAGDGTTEAVKLLLDAPAAENPVVMVAGNLAKSSRLRKLAEKSANARILISYAMTPRDAHRFLTQQARSLGLNPEQGVIEQLVASADADIGILRSELEKFALYLDASPEQPASFTHADLSALGADAAAEDLGDLVNAITSGNAKMAGRQLDLLADSSPIPALRAMARRLMQILEARTAMDQGQPADIAVKAVRPPIFWKDANLVSAALGGWPVARCRAGLRSMLATEFAIKTPGSAGNSLGWQALIRLVRR